MYFKLLGTKQGESVSLAARKDQSSEHTPRVNKEGKIINSLSDIRITYARVKEFEKVDEKTKKKWPKSYVIDIFFEKGWDSHVFNLGSSQMAMNVANAIAWSCVEELEHFNMSFYTQNGFNGVSTKKKDGTYFPVAIPFDDFKAMVVETKLPDGTTHKSYKERFDKLALLLQTKDKDHPDATKEYPARTVTKSEDFFDDFSDMMDQLPQGETYEQALAKEQAQKESSKITDTLDINDLPF